MSTVQEIREAIDHLPLQERAELVAGLCGWVDDEWDLQMKADAKAGKFDELNRQAESAQRDGKTRPLSDFLEKS
jgi:hypothetical protein